MDNTKNICDVIVSWFWKFYPFHTNNEDCQCKKKEC